MLRFFLSAALFCVACTRHGSLAGAPCSDQQECKDGTLCIRDNGPVTLPFGRCYATCASNETRCDKGLYCGPLAESEAKICYGFGDTGVGEFCASDLACESGLVCATQDVATPKTCHRICDPNAVTSECPAGESCVLNESVFDVALCVATPSGGNA